MYKEEELPFTKVTGITKFDKHEFKVSYEWKIYNIKISEFQPNDKIESPLFGPAENYGIKWKLAFYPSGQPRENEDYTSILLHFRPITNTGNTEANYEFYIRDKLGQLRHKIKLKNQFKKDDHYGSRQYVTKTDLLKDDNLISNGCLTLICNIFGTANYDSSANSNRDFTHFKVCDNCKLQCAYEALFNNQELSDVVFHVSEKKLYAHKSIVAAHSPVFLAMFKNDMKEKLCGQVDISDVQFDVFQEMLRFIYCGKTDNISTFVNDLLVLADKYAIQVLKAECEKHLVLTLNTDNVIDILSIADTYNASSLKQCATDFLIRHKNELVQKDVFKTIKKLQPETLEEIIRKLIMQ